MNIESSYLEKIAAQPDVDGLRLAYADWLEARNQTSSLQRAELIRVQCEIAKNPYLALTREDQELLHREATLLQTHGGEWLSAVKCFEQKDCKFEFVRGMIEHAVCSEIFFFQHWRELLETPELGLLNRLTLFSTQDDPPAKLADIPGLARFEHLDFRQCLLNDNVVEFIAASTHLGQLLSLSLGLGETAEFDRNEVRSAGLLLGNRTMTALADSPKLDRLTCLTLSGTDIDDTSIQILINSEFFENLHHLDLSDGNLTGESALQLAHKEANHSLQYLNLNLNQLGSAGAVAIASSRAFPSIRALYLRQNDIESEGWNALMQMAHVPRLIELDLSGNQISRSELKPFAAANTGLRSLVLRSSQLTDDILEIIARSGLLRNLRQLDLHQNNLTDKTTSLLFDTDHAPQLKHLTISGNGVTDEGVVAMSQSPKIASLRNLNLYLNPITEDGANALLRSTNLQRCRVILDTRNFKSSLVEQLNRRFGKP